MVDRSVAATSDGDGAEGELARWSSADDPAPLAERADDDSCVCAVALDALRSSRRPSAPLSEARVDPVDAAAATVDAADADDAEEAVTVAAAAVAAAAACASAAMSSGGRRSIGDSTTALPSLARLGTATFLDRPGATELTTGGDGDRYGMETSSR